MLQEIPSLWCHKNLKTIGISFVAVTPYFIDARLDQWDTFVFMIRETKMCDILMGNVFAIIGSSFFTHECFNNDWIDSIPWKPLKNGNVLIVLIPGDNLFYKQKQDAGDTTLLIQETQCDHVNWMWIEFKS